ncbi:MAG: hypothetical protein MK003_11735 [Pseudomonadales bacterium]|nr:hypothetical protein [Pseudomonadales bacterium]|tara:strand:- start:71 stop:538 length:468 start_codon:yes stop_codon:yes gene_type:complete
MSDQFVPTDDIANVEEIANSGDDKPVLMVNLNKYFEGEYPNGTAYKAYVKAHEALMSLCDGSKVLWRTPVYGQPIGTQPVDEILGIWYPSHKAFLAVRSHGKASEENFRLRNLVVENSVVHRCPEDGIPKPRSVKTQKSNLGAYANSSGYVYPEK